MEYPLRDYGSMLYYYTARLLTDQDDALRAMTGIVRRFTKAMGCKFFEGLPTALFDIFLLFKAPYCADDLHFPAIAGQAGAAELAMIRLAISVHRSTG
jgi:hypothetical protein